MTTNTVSILEGNTFVVSDRRGDIDATPTETMGLFHQDTRFLSRWKLSMAGKALSPLSVDNVRYFVARFFLVPGSGTIYVDSDVSLIRKRSVGDGFHEDLTVLNHSGKPIDVTLELEADADFADLFEVKDALNKKGERYRHVDDKRLVLGYRRDRFKRETWIVVHDGAQVSETGLRFQFHVPPHGEWNTCLEVVAATDVVGRTTTHTKYGHADDDARPADVDLAAWMDASPRLSCSWPNIERTYQRSLVDLAALRFFPLLLQGDPVPAAGLPWFMAVFGRDSLITSFQALPFAPRMAKATLQVLGARQGTCIDDFRDEEPGKILHESRMGELTAFEERPHSPYFGSADATPLFLVLLDEYELWTGDTDTIHGLRENALAALGWMDRCAERTNGYIAYERRNKETGLENQCWKDSWDSIQFSDGTLPGFPRATCEIQGYMYDAKIRCARLAREIWRDPELADKLTREAAELKRRFNQDFWLPDRGYFALALDAGTGRYADALTSNIGHLLWSGIVDDDKAESVVQHLMGPRLYSGWGVRTMAEGEAGYNPIGYHVGTLWPHDNSFIALGLRRYGYAKEAARIAMNTFEAASYFDYRLPEAFAGYAREATNFPVEYPTACSPQAWATGAPLLLLRVLFGLEPVRGHLLVDPAVPTSIGRLELLDIHGRWGKTDAFARGRIEL